MDDQLLATGLWYRLADRKCLVKPQGPKLRIPDVLDFSAFSWNSLSPRRFFARTVHSYSVPSFRPRIHNNTRSSSFGYIKKNKNQTEADWTLTIFSFNILRFWILGIYKTRSSRSELYNSHLQWKWTKMELAYNLWGCKSWRLAEWHHRISCPPLRPRSTGLDRWPASRRRNQAPRRWRDCCGLRWWTAGCMDCLACLETHRKLAA